MTTEKRKRGRPATGRKHVFNISVGVEKDVHDFVSSMARACNCANNRWLLNLVKKEMKRTKWRGVVSNETV